MQTQPSHPRSGNVTGFPIIYLPIEFQSREFDSKSLLAAVLADRGYSVVIGQQWMLNANISRLPPGVILFKSFNKIYQSEMAQARQAGHRVVILEEELLAQTEEKAIEAFCIDGIFDLPDLILADGQFEHDILKRLSGGRIRIEVTGNGRIDLLKANLRSLFQKQIDAIKLRYGDFVLVNTNFTILNSIWQSTEQVTRIQLAAGFIKPDDPASMQNWQDYLDFEEANRSALYAAIGELARRRPKQCIIVRPHPGEDLKRWNGLFAEYPNVMVIREGAHIPWTMACRVLLHTSCTTGFEAQVAGKVALSLAPRPSWITASLISNHVNPIFVDPIEFVSAAEKFIDGGAPPTAKPPAASPEYYVWNCAANNATQRIADLLVEGLPVPRPMSPPSLMGVVRKDAERDKFNVSLVTCTDTIERSAQALKCRRKVSVQSLGDSVFFVTTTPAAQNAVAAPQKLTPEQMHSAMQLACNARNFQKAFDVFKANFGEAHRHPNLCFLAGVALFELGEYSLALQYFQHSALANNAVNFNIASMMARTYQKLGELDTARRYAEQAYHQMPTYQPVFDLIKELSLQMGRPSPEHWLVIGCSNARCLRYLQINQPMFFEGKVHLECHEFAGATAFGLGNLASQSNALTATRQLRPRMAQADRVIVQFGEIDCRRAAWKAAETTGRSIKETIAESVRHLETYLADEVLPFQRKVLILGAKPQIVADDDFYKNSLEDERTIFKPLAERERITLSFNAQVRQVAQRLKVDYADIDHLLADARLRRELFENAFWDSYTTDTHGNSPYFASLYFRVFQEFVGKRGA